MALNKSFCCRVRSNSQTKRPWIFDFTIRISYTYSKNVTEYSKCNFGCNKLSIYGFKQSQKDLAGKSEESGK